MSESLFNKVEGIRPETLLKKRLRDMCSTVNFAKFSEHLFDKTETYTNYCFFGLLWCFIRGVFRTLLSIYDGGTLA